MSVAATLRVTGYSARSGTANAVAGGGLYSRGTPAVGFVPTTSWVSTLSSHVRMLSAV